MRAQPSVWAFRSPRKLLRQPPHTREVGIKSLPRGSLAARACPRAAGRSLAPGDRGTHRQVQHVHRHRLLRQHLHGGVRVDCDRAAAHCKGKTAGAESGSAARQTSFGGPHAGQHWQADPWDLHDPFAKTKPQCPPITYPRSRRDSFPAKREAKTVDASRESEQNQESLAPDHGPTLSPISQGRSPALQGSLQQPL